jgi:hypothetical protein
MELHGIKRPTRSALFFAVDFYIAILLMEEVSKLNSLHSQKEEDSTLKNLLGFPIQIRKLFFRNFLLTNAEVPTVQINKDYL